MKTFISILFLTLLSWVNAETGIFDSKIIIETNTETKYNTGSNSPSFPGSFGSFTFGETFILKGGEIKTWKNGGSDVTGATMYYRIYTTGNEIGSFIGINLPFSQNLIPPGDQEWANAAASIDLLDGLSNGVYTLEIYFQSNTNLGERHDNNGGANYKANFTYTDDLVLNDGAVIVNPANPSRTEPITITLDATGTDLATATKVYFHAGIGSDAPGSKNFSNTIGNWGQDDTIGEMTELEPLGNNRWKITLTSADNYFGLTDENDAFAINFLFRNADGTKKEDFNKANYHVELQPGPYFILETPTYSPFLVEVGQAFEITASADPSTTWKLFSTDENGDNPVQVTAADQTGTNFIYSPTISDASTHYFKLEADFGGGVVKSKTFYLKGYLSPTVATLPIGAKKGVNHNFPNTGEVTLILHTPTNTTYNYYDNNNCEGTNSDAETEEKKVVHLIGDFNDWEIQENYKLNIDGDYWWITLKPTTEFPSPLTDEYVYQYLIDGEIRIGDPYANKISDPDDQYILNDIYPNLIPYPSGQTTGRASVLQLNPTEYSWQVPNFERQYNSNELNVYELHFRDFTNEGTYKAATAKLDYIKELGINTIHVMPISEFEGNDSWGYNPNYYFAADKAYGTANDLKEFIDEAHKRGIAVVNDLVLNHAFYSNPNAMMYWDKVNNRPAQDNPWFNAEHKGVFTPDGHWGADWNHASEHTQEMVDDILKYWITEFKFDGFRFDFTKGFTQADPDSDDEWGDAYNQCRIDILMRMTNEMWALDDAPIKLYSIFEHLASPAEEKVLALEGILLWSGAGPQEDWVQMAEGNGIRGFEKSWYQNRNFTYANYMSYMESHDEERLGYKVLNYGLGRDGTTKYLTDRLKLVAAFNMLMPGPRMVWQFGELGYDISIDENGRTGRKPVAWELGYDQDSDRKELYNLYSHIFNFRNKYNLYQDFQMRNNIGNTTDWKRTMSGHDMGSQVQVISIGNFEPGVDNSVQPEYYYTGTWFKYNGDPAVDGTPFEVTNSFQDFPLPKNDPVYVLSNKDIIPPIFNVEPTIISTDYCQYTLPYTYDITPGIWSAGSTTFGKVADNSGSVTLELLEINGETTNFTTLAGFQPQTGENLITWRASDTSGNETVYTQSITIERGECHKPGVLGVSAPSGVLISTLNRDIDNQTTTKQNGILVLESKTKGLVLTSIPEGRTTADITEPVDGMLVFDENDSCIKLYDGTQWSCIKQKAIPQP